MHLFKTLALTILITIGYKTFSQKSNGFELPPYEKFVLPNGLTVYLMEQHEVPLISVSVVLPAGAIYDNRKFGLASITANALMNGTQKMSKNELEEALDFVGAQVNTYAGKEEAGLTAKFATKDKDKVLSIIRDILLEPLFDKEEFEKEKRLTLSRLEQARESPRSVINDYFDQLIFGNHVYANPQSGRSSSVNKLLVGDVRQFYANNYVPNGSAIAITGDIQTRDMKKLVTQLFSGWKKGKLPVNQAGNAVEPVKQANVMLVNKSDANETTFIIGGPGVARSNPDYVAIEVVNTVFGGRFTSWLNDELRVNTGLTYGARSGFGRLKHAGTFQISTFTALKNTEAAIDKAIEVLHRLHDKGIDEKTLTSAKNYIKGGFPPRYETAGQLANLLTQMFWYGFDESFINNFQKNVDELTVAKANDIIAKYYPKDKLQFVLIGKASEIKDIALKYGKVTAAEILKDTESL